MQRSRAAGLMLLGGSMTVLAVTSARWAVAIGVSQLAGLVGMIVLFVVLALVVVHKSSKTI